MRIYTRMQDGVEQYFQKISRAEMEDQLRYLYEDYAYWLGAKGQDYVNRAYDDEAVYWFTGDGKFCSFPDDKPVMYKIKELVWTDGSCTTFFGLSKESIVMSDGIWEVRTDW